MKWITVQECQQRMKTERMHLVDVREDWEHDICTIDAEHVPMHMVEAVFAARDKSANYVIVCKSGNRAQAVANLLETEECFRNVYVLEGGIAAWLTFTDPTFEIY